MSAAGESEAGAGACASCLRRGWLLSLLSSPLEYTSRDRGRLLDLLALGDVELLQAVGGRRREELAAAYARFAPGDLPKVQGVETVCVHDRRYPRGLVDPGAPRSLNVVGGVERLRELTNAPSAAIVGSDRATDYGMEMSRELARGLAASGVTVTSGLSDGIAVAAHAGALQVDGRPLAVVPGGVDAACPARRRSLYERVQRRGCAVAELPCGCKPRRWGQAAAERIIAGLAGLTVVVEAGERPGDLACARIAQTLGRTVAAVPGRVTAPSSRGTHALLMEGAHLVRGPADALELLCGPGTPAAVSPADARPELEPRLKATLERVGAGRDTPGRLENEGEDAGELLLALSELELMGLLTRGDGGRYVPRNPFTT